MRLLIVILVLTTLVIVDQFKFRGYYSAEISRLVAQAIRSVS